MTVIGGVLVSEVDKEDYTLSIATLRAGGMWLDSVQIEELITDLELKLQEIKETKNAN